MSELDQHAPAQRRAAASPRAAGFFATLATGAVAAGMLFTPVARAQPTGNPKGTMQPSTRGEAQDAPATPGRSVGSGTGSGTGSAAAGAQTNPDSRPARSGGLGTPGSGTTGGLSGHHPKEGNDGTGTTGGNQAPPAKRP